MSLQNMGVTVEAIVDGKTFFAEEDGHIVGGEFLEDGNVITLRVVVSARRNRQPIGAKRDGKGGMVELRDDASSIVDDAVYEISVPVSETEEGVVVPAAWPDNFMYIIPRGLEGKFQVIQVSVISQSGVFSLRVQEMYAGTAWLNAGRFQVGNGQEFGAWAKLIPILEKAMRRQQLPTTPPPAPKPISVPTEPNTGVVKFYGDAMDFGYALVSPSTQVFDEETGRLVGIVANLAERRGSNEVKVHWSQIVSGDRFKHLRSGWGICFQRVIMREGARGDHKGKLRPELEGVEIISRG